MISALFSIPKIQDGRHIVLIMLSDLLKKPRKYEISISLLNLKCIFWPNPWNIAFRSPLFLLY